MRKSTALLTMVVAVMIVALGSASATRVADGFHFDGTYAPDTGKADVPAGNTTWTVAKTGASAMTPNQPTAGVLDFNDSDGGGRIAMARTYSDAGFNADPAGYEWEYTFRMELKQKPTGYSQNMPFGLRNEGDGNGKAIALTFNPSGELCFASNSFGGILFSDLGGVGTDYQDAATHDFTVEKVIGGGETNINTYVDGALVFTTNYSAFNDDSSTEGFGIWSSTPGTGRYYVDDVRFAGEITEAMTDNPAAFWNLDEPDGWATTPVADVFNYNGTYTNNPPTGDADWAVFNNGITMNPNSPSAGVLDFYDAGGAVRGAISRTYTDPGFNADPAGYEWEYTFRLQLMYKPNYVSSPAPFGLRSEGNGNGKAIALTFNPDGELCFATADFGGMQFSDLGGSGTDYQDGSMHDFTVKKVIDGGGTNINTYVDGSLIFTTNYSAFADDTHALGFGLWSGTPGTVRYYVDNARFSATVAADSAGNAFDGTYSGDVAQGVDGAGDDLSNLAVDFDGVDDYLNATTLGGWGSQITNNGVSLEMWVKSTTTTESTICGFLDNGNSDMGMEILANSPVVGDTRFWLRDGHHGLGWRVLRWRISDTIYDGAWHQIVWVIDDPATNSMQIYVDGLDATITTELQEQPYKFDDLTDALYFGGLNNRGDSLARPFDGSLDGIAIYDYALSADQVLEHYQAVDYHPTEIVDFTPVSSSNMMLTVRYASDSAYPVAATDLVASNWARVGHSDAVTNAYATTNLYYSTSTNGNKAIYVKSDLDDTKFFRIEE